MDICINQLLLINNVSNKLDYLHTVLIHLTCQYVLKSTLL